MKAFEPSRMAALFWGPKTGMLASARSSASPATNGASGPMTTMPTSFSLQKSMTCARRKIQARLQVGCEGPLQSLQP